MSRIPDFWAARHRVQMLPADHRPDFKNAVFEEHFVDDKRLGITGRESRVAVALLLGQLLLDWDRERRNS